MGCDAAGERTVPESRKTALFLTARTSKESVRFGPFQSDRGSPGHFKDQAMIRVRVGEAEAEQGRLGRCGW